MKIHLLSGFLGSGKTTAIGQVSTYLQGKGRSVGVIANDQGTQLVDSAIFDQSHIPNRQVVNGCFCCNYDEFERSVDQLMTQYKPDVIFAESVGSCTDIVATVIHPMLRYSQHNVISLSTFADIRLLKIMLENTETEFHESVRYLYFKQLEEASVLVVTKIDLVNEAYLNRVKLLVEDRYKDKVVLYLNSLEQASIQSWIDVLDGLDNRSSLVSMDVDYDIYGQGESKLAWFDQQVEIYSGRNASEDAIKLIQAIRDRVVEAGYPIGHLKFLVDDKVKINFTTVLNSQELDSVQLEKKLYIKFLINARIQTRPELLSELMNSVVKEVGAARDCFILVKNTASFQPGMPRPKHRIAVAT